MATSGGADDFVSAAAFASAKEDWFRERLGLRLPDGIPSHGTLNRVFAILAPEPFQKCFFGFVKSRSGRLKLKPIPIDGRAMRGSKRKTLAGHRMAHTVSAWAPESGVTLAQLRTDEKPNEITAAPELLASLDVSGALAGIDAMGCQKDIAAPIVDQKWGDLLAVKDNQPRLFEDRQRLADAASEPGYEGLSTNLPPGTGRGREEMRFCSVIEDVASVRDRNCGRSRGRSWGGRQPSRGPGQGE